jgi:hypothetical protein
MRYIPIVCAVVSWRSYSATTVVVDMRRVYTGHILMIQLAYFILQSSAAYAGHMQPSRYIIFCIYEILLNYKHINCLYMRCICIKLGVVRS